MQAVKESQASSIDNVNAVEKVATVASNDSPLSTIRKRLPIGLMRGTGWLYADLACVK